MPEPAYAATFSGYVIVFGSKDAGGTAFERGCITPMPAQVPLFWNHDRTQPIGRARNFVANDHGLRCNIDLARVADGYAALSQIRGGLCRGLSPGCRIYWRQRRWFRRGYRLQRVELYEVSLTPTPRFPGAGILPPLSK